MEKSAARGPPAPPAAAFSFELDRNPSEINAGMRTLAVLAAVVLLLALSFVSGTPSPDPDPQAELECAPFLPPLVVANIARCMDVASMRSTHPLIRLHLHNPDIVAAVFVNSFRSKAMLKMYNSNITDLRAYAAAMALTEQSKQGRLFAISLAACQQRHDMLTAWIEEHSDEEMQYAGAGAAWCDVWPLLAWLRQHFDRDFNTQAVDSMFATAGVNGQAGFMERLLESYTMSHGATLDRMLVKAAENGHVDIVRRTLACTYGPQPTLGAAKRAIKAAAARGHLDVVTSFRPFMQALAPPYDFDTIPLVASAALEHSEGYADIISFLLTCPETNSEMAANIYSIAAQYGRTDAMDLVFKIRTSIFDHQYILGAPLGAAALAGHLEAVKKVYMHGRPEQHHVNRALGYALSIGHNDVIHHLLREAPKTAHGPRRRSSYFGWKFYVNGWTEGLVLALNAGRFTQAESILSRYKPDQVNQDSIFIRSWGRGARVWLVKRGIAPSEIAVDLAFDGAVRRHLDLDEFFYDAMPRRPSQDAIDLAFGDYALAKYEFLVRLYGYPQIQPSMKKLKEIVLKYASGKPVAIELLLEKESDRLSDAALALLPDVISPLMRTRLLELSRL